MNALNPAALWLLPLVALLFWLARRPRERTRRVVSGLWLWHATVSPDALQLSSTRRRTWLLLVQALFMVLVILAMARLVAQPGVRQATFVLDVSASMSARAPGGTSLDLARQAALAALDRVPSTAGVRVIAAGGTARDLGRFAAADPRLRALLASLPVTAESARLNEAVRLARALDPAAAIWVFSDASPASPLSTASVTWIRVGAPADNVAVTAAATRRRRAPPYDADVLVELFNFGRTARTVTLDVDLNGRSIARETVALNARSSRTLARTVADGDGVVTARIEVPADDAIEIDNQRVAALEPRRPIRVRVAGAGRAFLEQALAANASLVLERSTPSPQAADSDVVVCDGCTEPPPAAAAVLIVPASTGPVAPPAPVAVERPEHAVLDAVDLAGLAAVPVMAPPLASATVLIRAGETPLLAVREQRGQRVAALSLDFRSSALPLSAAFPVLVSNLIEWLARADAAGRTVSAGDPLQVLLPDAPGIVSVTGPEGGPRTARVVDRLVTVDDTSAPGIYTVRANGIARRMAINPDTSTESDVSAPGRAAISIPDAESAAARMELRAVLLVAALALLGLEWWLTRGAARGLSFACRAAAAALVAIAAMGLRLPIPSGPMTTVFVVDRSDSVPLRAQRDALARVNRLGERMRRGDAAALVSFGSDAAIDRPAGAWRRVDTVGAAVSTVGTNIEAALALARSSLPPAGLRRVVLVSDGHETSGDSAREAALSAAAGIRIDVLPVGDDAGPGWATVRRVGAPEQARVGEPYRVSIVVHGAPGAQVSVAVEREGAEPLMQDVQIGPAGIGRVELTERRVDPGVYTYRARVDTGDPGEATEGAVVAVEGEPAVAYVGAGGTLQPWLAAAGYRIERFAPETFPAGDRALSAFDAVIVDDVAPERLSADRATALRRFVENDGGGLLWLGGPASLTAAGFAGGDLGSLLPVDLRPRAGRRGPSVAFVLVFDKSGSMAERVEGIQKIELARQAATQVAETLPPTDALGVIAFDAQPTVIAPLGGSTDAAALADRLRAIEPAGSTAIAPAVELAASSLAGAAAARRHILLVTDGRTSAEDADRLRASVRSRTVELSVVAIGADADRDLLRGLAADTGGRAYFPDDLRELPRIAVRDAMETAGGTIVEERFTPRAPTPHPVLSAAGGLPFPPLNGYVVGAVRPGADALLVSHLDDPVLAAWRAGLGRVAVFTAGFETPWSSALRGWRAAPPVWAQLVRWVGRRSTADLQVRLAAGDGEARVTLDTETAGGTVIALDEAMARVGLPDGGHLDVPLRPMGPGRYEARVPVRETGRYSLAISARNAATGDDVHQLRGLYWSADRERLGRGVDLARLLALAERTGGRRLGENDSPFDEPRPLGAADLSTELAGAALVTFLAAVAMPWRALGAVRRRFARSRTRGAGVEAAA